MERKNTILLTIIAVATLLVAVVGATFAFFTATGNANQNSAVTVTTPGIDVVSGTSTPCTLQVTASDMQEANIPQGDTYVDIHPGTGDECVVQMSATKADATSYDTCPFTITYTPATGKNFTNSTNNQSGAIEFSLTGTGVVTYEDNSNTVTVSSATSPQPDYNKLSVYTITGTERDLNGVSAEITLASGNFIFDRNASAVWTFVPHFYNRNYNQNDLAGHEYGGTIQVNIGSCTHTQKS